jgi:uncharacterized membrane protein YobD (UPF0266 family)
LVLGFLILVAGLVSYLAWGIYKNQPWSIAFVLMGLVLLGFYIFWFRLQPAKRERAMQRAVRWVKPLSWVAVPYIAWWLVK